MRGLARGRDGRTRRGTSIFARNQPQDGAPPRTGHTGGPIPGVEDDSELARAAAARDPEAWAAIYTRFHAPIYRYARARVGLGAAEDVTAEVFSSAVNSIAKYSGQRPLLAWLYGIAKHRVADHHRRNRPRESLLARFARGLSGVVDDAELRHTIEALGSSADDPGTRVAQLDIAPALQRLTAEQREVIVLRFLVGLSTPEIAAAMGRGASAIYSLEARALARLRKDLGE